MAIETAIIETNLSKAVIDLLVNIPMFDSLKSDELSIVSSYMNFMDFEPRETVFQEGERGDYVCFVSEGALDVLKRNEKGKQVIIASLGRGRSIGEMSVIDDFPRSATVRARTKTTLVILTRKGFERIVNEHAKIGVKMLKGISRILSMNLRRTSSRLADCMLPIS